MARYIRDKSNRDARGTTLNKRTTCELCKVFYFACPTRFFLEKASLAYRAVGTNPLLTIFDSSSLGSAMNISYLLTFASLVMYSLTQSAWAQRSDDPKSSVSTTETRATKDHARVDYFWIESQAIQPIQGSDDWQVRRNDVLKNVQLVMGPLPDRTKLPTVKLEILEEVLLEDGIVRKEIRFLSEGDDWVNAYLMLPKLNNLRTGVLCLHQTVPMGKEEPVGLGGNPNLRYAKELAERGMVTLTPDYPSFGDHPYNFQQHPEWKSGSMKAIWDNMRAIDLLLQLGVVDANRIGCIGHSLGGHNAIFTAFFDERIRAVVSSCGFTRFHKYYQGDLKGWTSDRYMPRISTQYGNDPNRVPFDFPELIAGLAPRGFFTSSPVRDDNFDADGVRDTIKQAEFIYQLLHANGHLQAIYPDSAHDFPPAARELAYRFLAVELQKD